MNLDNHSSKKKTVLKIGDLIPFLTILAGGIAIGLSLFEVIKLSMPEGIIIALLILLASDALTERLTILRSIDDRFKKILIGPILRSRDEIIPFSEYVKNSSEICIAAVSAVAICPSNIKLFREKLDEGCSIKIVLLNPESKSLETLHNQYGAADAENGIKTSLQCLKGLFHDKKSKGKLVVKLLDVFLPTSLIAVDLGKKSGSILVEFHLYRTPVDGRPHNVFTARENPTWFNLFKQQFEKAWSDSKPWNP